MQAVSPRGGFSMSTDRENDTKVTKANTKVTKSFWNVSFVAFVQCFVSFV